MNRSRRKRRNRRILIRVAVGAVLVYLLLGFLVLPRVIKGQLESRVTALLGRATTVEKVRTNPLTLSVTLSGLTIREPNDSGEFIGWDRLYVNADAWRSLLGSWRLREVTLEGFRAAVKIDPAGSLNFSDLLESAAREPAPSDSTPERTSRPVHIGTVTVTEARVSLDDRSTSQPFQSVAGPVSFVLEGFHTGGEVDAPYHFAAVTEAGERVEWTGTLNAAPFRSEGTLQLSSIILGKYAPYHAPFVQADVRSGVLSVSGRYEVDLTEGARVLRWHEGIVALRDMEILERVTGRTALTLPALEVTGIDVDAVAKKATVARVALQGGKALVRREVGGEVNLVTMLQPDATLAAQTSSSTAEPAATAARESFDVKVGEVAVSGFAVDWIDLAAPWPAQLGVTDLAVNVTNVSLAPETVMPVNVSGSWIPSGTLAVEGEVRLQPSVSATLQSRVADLSLVPLGPYVEGVANARIARGTLSTQHRLVFTLGDAGPRWDLEGVIGLADLMVEDTAQGEEIAGLSRLDLTGLKVTPDAILIESAHVTGPTVRAAVAEDGTFNLSKLAKQAPAEAVPAAPPPPAAPVGGAPSISILSVSIEGGSAAFIDQSVQPHVRMTLGGFGGTVKGLSSENLTRANVNLRGSVDGVGPVTIDGRLDPLGPKPFVDLDVAFRNVDLTAFSPYSAKYAGFDLARGKLRVDVDFSLNDTRLESDNVITLDQFNFGAASNSPDATKLPVRLAVALLKDTEGKIVIDVPVEGRTDDPEFRVGRVVVRVIVNLLTKAAVSPFALLGSMFGGGGDELAFQEFAPGQALLLESERPKLVTMEKALKDRPGINLSIAGTVDEEADRSALRRLRFEAKVRTRLAAEGWQMGPAEQLVVANHPEVIKKLFDEAFPPGSEQGTPLPQPPPVVTPPPAAEGALQRVIDTITLKTRREQREAEEENARRAAAYAAALEMIAAQGLPVETMVARLEANEMVSDDDLRELSTARATVVRQHFITVGEISPDRLFLSPAGASSQPSKGMKALLSLQ